MAYFILGLLAVFSSSGLAAFGLADGAIPDPALAICLAASLIAEKHRDLTLALVLGLGAGLFSATPWGLKALGFLLAALLIGVGRDSARLDQGFSRLAIATAAAGLAGLVEVLAAQADQGFLEGTFDYLLRSMGTAALALLILNLFGKGRLFQGL